MEPLALGWKPRIPIGGRSMSLCNRAQPANANLPRLPRDPNGPMTTEATSLARTRAGALAQTAAGQPLPSPRQGCPCPLEAGPREHREHDRVHGPRCPSGHGGTPLTVADDPRRLARGLRADGHHRGRPGGVLRPRHETAQGGQWRSDSLAGGEPRVSRSIRSWDTRTSERGAAPPREVALGLPGIRRARGHGSWSPANHGRLEPGSNPKCSVAGSSCA